MPKTDVEVQLVGTDGNVFAIIGAVLRALKEAARKARNEGLDEYADVLRTYAKEFPEQAMQQESYDAVLRLCHEYVEVY